MKFSKKLYFSLFGNVISVIQNLFAFFHRPFMVYGYYNLPSRTFKKYTRISSTALLMNRKGITINDNCWIWHHSIIDGSYGVHIGEGVQIGAWVGIFTHSSHISIRLNGRDFIKLDAESRIGYVRKPVTVGDYVFIGAGALILPGVEIGKGSLVAAGSVVSKSVPSFSIVGGNPARVIGNTKGMDEKYFGDREVLDQYFDRELIDNYLESIKRVDL